MRNSILCTALLWLCHLIAAAQDVERGYIAVSDGCQIYYEAQGSGTPVVLLHGHTLNLTMWDPQMDSLTAHYRVIRPEMRGYGHSSKMKMGYHFTHLDDMMTVIDSLHLDRFHVVGLSMGSFVASEMVALYPERIISATLASGNIRKSPGPSTPYSDKEKAQQRERIARNKAMGLAKWKQNWLNDLIKNGGSNAESIRADVARQLDEWDGWQCFNADGRIYYGLEAWDSLRAKCPTVPCLILSGEKEEKGKPNPMLQYLPNGRQYIIPDCGHMTNMEKPEEFTRLILELMRSAEAR